MARRKDAQGNTLAGSLQTLVEGDLSKVLSFVASLVGVGGFCWTILSKVGVQLFGFGGPGAVPTLDATFIGFSLMLILMMALGCGWAFGFLIDQLARINPGSRMIASLGLAVLLAFVLVGFCGSLITVRSGSHIMAVPAAWFACFVAIASITGLYAARLKFHHPMPAIMQERAAGLMLTPVFVFAFFLVHLFA